MALPLTCSLPSKPDVDTETMRAATLFLSPLPFSLKPTLTITPSLFFHSPPPLAFPTPKLRPALIPLFLSPNSPFVVHANNGNGYSGSPDEYNMDDEELEKVVNKKDFDFDYDPLAAGMSASIVVGVDKDIAMVQSKSFISMQGWESEMVADCGINKDEFRQISLLHYDFFIRKPPPTRITTSMISERPGKDKTPTISIITPSFLT